MPKKILSQELLKKWDESTIVNRQISFLELMESAARQCTSWIHHHFSNEFEVHVFCGKGNNGGDGLATARLLKEKNYRVHVYVVEESQHATECFSKNFQRLTSSGLEVSFIHSETTTLSIGSKSIVVDALFGSGLNRPVSGLTARIIEQINALNATVISIDVPSGMFVDKSSDQNTIVRATFTLTFQILKLCFLVPENAVSFGKIEILNIGLDPKFLQESNPVLFLTDIHDIRRIHKTRNAFSHKGTYGHSLLVAGSKEKMGAAVLCARACLRSGTGLLTCCIPETGFSVLNSTVPESMAISQADNSVHTNLDLYRSVGIGPGLDTKADSEKIVRMVTYAYKKPMVVDADALNIISKNKNWMHSLPPDTILTPHPKEFERLFGPSENDFDRIDKALAMSLEFNVIIVLKNHHSLVASAGRGYFNPTGNAGMATGGSGDVLTGIITALLSQGYVPEEAAVLGVYLHGLAADFSLQNQSVESMLPSDMIEHLGRAFQEISLV